MYQIATLPGDGIGGEVLEAGLQVLKTLSGPYGFTYQLTPFPFGADHYLKTGEVLPPSGLKEMADHQVIYLGAIGDPRTPPGLLEKGIVLKLRFELDLYINLRPIKLFHEKFCPLKGKTPEDIDFVVIRENTEGLYCGIGGKFKEGTPDEIATQSMIASYKGVERATRYAFEVARKRGKKNKLTLVDKNNVLTYVFSLWRRVFEEVGRDFPEIEKDSAYVDAACMWMVKNPENFDVIVVENMFGDIITDLGAMLQGGLGIAASGNINPLPGRVSMFEPIHGSAPKYKGKNVANPVAAISALAMMLDHLGETKASQSVEQAIMASLSSGEIPSLDARSGLSTQQITDVVIKNLPFK